MQKLSKAAIGRSYTIQWMFGVPEVMDFLREHHVEEGDNIQIIRKLKDALILLPQRSMILSWRKAA